MTQKMNSIGDIKHKAKQHIQDAVNALIKKFKLEIVFRGEYTLEEIAALDDEEIVRCLYMFVEHPLRRPVKVNELVLSTPDGHKAVNRVRAAVNEWRANFEVEMMDSGKYDYDEIVALDDAAITKEFVEYIHKKTSRWVLPVVIPPNFKFK